VEPLGDASIVASLPPPSAVASLAAATRAGRRPAA
jgi:hypothetical protein